MYKIIKIVKYDKNMYIEFQRTNTENTNMVPRLGTWLESEFVIHDCYLCNSIRQVQNWVQEVQEAYHVEKEQLPLRLIKHRLILIHTTRKRKELRTRIHWMMISRTTRRWLWSWPRREPRCWCPWDISLTILCCRVRTVECLVGKLSLQRLRTVSLFSSDPPRTLILQMRSPPPWQMQAHSSILICTPLSGNPRRYLPHLRRVKWHHAIGSAVSVSPALSPDVLWAPPK